MKEYNLKHKERLRKYSAEYYQKNKAKCKIQQKGYWIKRKEHWKNLSQEDRDRNIELCAKKVMKELEVSDGNV